MLAVDFDDSLVDRGSALEPLDAVPFKLVLGDDGAEVFIKGKGLDVDDLVDLDITLIV